MTKLRWDRPRGAPVHPKPAPAPHPGARAVAAARAGFLRTFPRGRCRWCRRDRHLVAAGLCYACYLDA